MTDSLGVSLSYDLTSPVLNWSMGWGVLDGRTYDGGGGGGGGGGLETVAHLLW